jgi:hypothetical protein
MTDRLTEIKDGLAETKRGAVFPSCERADTDMRWLVAEMERLQADADDDLAIITRAKDVCHRHGYTVDANHEGWIGCALRHLQADLAALRARLDALERELAEMTDGYESMKAENETLWTELRQRGDDCIDPDYSREKFYVLRKQNRALEGALNNRKTELANAYDAIMNWEHTCKKDMDIAFGELDRVRGMLVQSNTVLETLLEPHAEAVLRWAALRLWLQERNTNTDENRGLESAGDEKGKP